MKRLRSALLAATLAAVVARDGVPLHIVQAASPKTGKKTSGTAKKTVRQEPKTAAKKKAAASNQVKAKKPKAENKPNKQAEAPKPAAKKTAAPTAGAGQKAAAKDKVKAAPVPEKSAVEDSIKEEVHRKLDIEKVEQRQQQQQQPPSTPAAPAGAREPAAAIPRKDHSSAAKPDRASEDDAVARLLAGDPSKRSRQARNGSRCARQPDSSRTFAHAWLSRLKC